MNVKKYLLIVASVVMIFVAVASGVFVARIAVSPFKVGDHGNALQPVRSDGIVNILVVGMDTVGYNTDVMMVLNINKKDSKVNVMSVPRDTRVYVGGNYRKLNSVYAYAINTGQKKEELLISTISDLTGLPIHYYAVINTKTFREIVDALGGVEYNVPRDYIYDDPYQDLHICIYQGQQVLDGQAAEGLIRYRADYANGDLQRIEVQQDFISEMVRQKLRPEYIFQLPEVYDSLTENVISNLTVGDLTEYAKLCLDIGVDNVATYMIPGHAEYVGSTSYYLKDDAGTAQLLSTEFGY